MPPLVKKYEPKTFDDVIGNPHIVNSLKKWTESYKDGKHDFPNLIFAGAPGVGKTASAKVLARAMFGDQWQMCFRDLNASDERGIDVIRNKVKTFARSKPLADGINIVFLDEADNLTKDAQYALRRIMEDYAQITRFILSCNYPNHLIEPIRSRSCILRFGAVPEEEIATHLKKIITAEHIGATEDALKEISAQSHGRVRDAVNFLNELVPLQPITVDMVRELMRKVPASVYTKMYSMLKEGKASEVDKGLLKMMTNGYATDELFASLLNEVLGDAALHHQRKAQAIYLIAEAEYRVNVGCSPTLQLRALIWSLAGAVR